MRLGQQQAGPVRHRRSPLRPSNGANDSAHPTTLPATASWRPASPFPAALTATGRSPAPAAEIVTRLAWRRDGCSTASFDRPTSRTAAQARTKRPPKGGPQKSPLGPPPLRVPRDYRVRRGSSTPRSRKPGGSLRHRAAGGRPRRLWLITPGWRRQRVSRRLDRARREAGCGGGLRSPLAWASTNPIALRPPTVTCPRSWSLL